MWNIGRSGEKKHLFLKNLRKSGPHRQQLSFCIYHVCILWKEQKKCVHSNSLISNKEAPGFFFLSVPPKIDPIETLSGTEEARGRLSCSAVGDPQPSVTWKREDQSYYYVEQPSGVSSFSCSCTVDLMN